MAKIELSVRELRLINQELRKEKRLETIRSVLKLLLVGFLLPKRRKISELNARKDLLLKRIDGYFEELDALSQQIRKIENLAQFESDLKFLLANEPMEEGFVSKEKEYSAKYRQIILNCVRSLIKHRNEAIKIEINRIQNSRTYLVYSEKQRCVEALKEFEDELTCFSANKSLEEEFVAYRQDLENCRLIASSYNEEFIRQRKRDYNYLFNKRDFSLDDEQKDAVVTDDKHNLVIAGAGTGKTEVLITRIAYLIERKPDGIRPNRILAIAFQNKAKSEIEQRLRERYNISGVNVKTFHKLGKDLLEKSGGKIKHTDIIDENKSRIVREIYERRLKEPSFFEAFLRYVRSFHDHDQNDGYSKKEDVLEFKRALSYVAINNVRVNSRAEKEILDFFLLNKLNGESVKIEYEPDVADFRPDFGLAKYGLFVEHWALDEEGEVPSWFNQSTENYKENMKRKRAWFARNGKLLVETFAHEYDEDDPGKFLELLRQRIIKTLQAKFGGKFEFSQKSYAEVVEIAWAPYDDPIATDIISFIRNAKTYGLTPEKVMEKLHTGKWSCKQLAFGNLAVKVYSDYEEELRKQRKIDFEDMINKAIIELLKDESLFTNVYDHILVDEYQDISSQRCKLIKIVLNRNPHCKLFCVGDDWQSIMGFAGSNVNFFVAFHEYFENPAITKISTNYRSLKSIVDAGADVIKNNGASQIPKPTVSSRYETNPIRVISSAHNKDFEARYHDDTAQDCLRRIADYIRMGYAPNDILVLSRYKFPRVVKAFIEKAEEEGIQVAFDNEFAKSNQIRLMTAHKSKGLQARVVFILDFTKGVYGFPCEIEDPAIYAPARENYPPCNHRQEERRLFYVALTRAKEDLTIYTWEPAKSQFLEEIKQHCKEEPLYY